MIAVLKSGTTDAQAAHLVEWLESLGLEIHKYAANTGTVLGIIGDLSRVDVPLLQSMSIVESVKRVSDPFKQANRKFHPQDTVVNCGGVLLGGGHLAVIAGPCSVESEEQIITVAQAV